MITFYCDFCATTVLPDFAVIVTVPLVFLTLPSCVTVATAGSVEEVYNVFHRPHYELHCFFGFTRGVTVVVPFVKIWSSPSRYVSVYSHLILRSFASHLPVLSIIVSSKSDFCGKFSCHRRRIRCSLRIKAAKQTDISKLRVDHTCIMPCFLTEILFYPILFFHCTKAEFLQSYPLHNNKQDLQKKKLSHYCQWKKYPFHSNGHVRIHKPECNSASAARIRAIYSRSLDHFKGT